MSSENPPPPAFGDTWQAAHNLQKSREAVMGGKEIRRMPSELFRCMVSLGFYHVDPIAFELVMKQVFEIFGFTGALTPPTGDDGIDILLRSPKGSVSIVQCKRYSEELSVSPREVREFLGSLTFQKAAYGYFVSTSRFSSQAREFCNEHKILLIDGKGIEAIFLLAEEVLLNPGRYSESLKDPDAFLITTLKRMGNGSRN